MKLAEMIKHYGNSHKTFFISATPTHAQQATLAQL